MSENAAVAAEIEVRVGGQVNYRIFVSGRAILDPKLVVARQNVVNVNRQISRVILFSGRADIRQVHHSLISAALGACLPKNLVKAIWPTMQMIDAIVLRQLKLVTV